MCCLMWHAPQRPDKLSKRGHLLSVSRALKSPCSCWEVSLAAWEACIFCSYSLTLGFWACPAAEHQL